MRDFAGLVWQRVSNARESKVSVFILFGSYQDSVFVFIFFENINYHSLNSPNYLRSGKNH